ncbi:hypothetical protein [Paenibacillus flagellatus]|uniref:Uncharacterized protein n=1 Tax=Paenibacillus flagellatus TaxID=2211139 RepID=A0A2V5K8U8_9BACL|nr:hypothetical protein [Paenibacillus flagellatus]PYI54474.1 hypothetical protein DLM86_13485 [Paenibacillus flagellatus]
MAGKKVKKQAPGSRVQAHYKIVSSDVCAVCRQQCERGIRYMARLERPGAVGNGVPCVLTRYFK